MIAPSSSEEHLLQFLYACPVGLVECDAGGEISMINPHAMQHLLPLAGTRDTGNFFAILEQHAPEIVHLVAGFQRATGRICDGHRIMVDLGNGRRSTNPKVLSCTLVRLGADRLMATLSDISDQVAQEQRLRQADTWFATLLDQINDYAIVTLSADGLVVAANAYFTQQTGHVFNDVRDRRLATVLGHDATSDEAMLDEQMGVAARDGWHLQEGWQLRASGERYWCQRLVVVRLDTDATQPPSFSVVMRDVPRRGAVADDLRRLLTCDHLTGAANRMHFSQMLERARTHWQEVHHPVSLIAVDLDRFKVVNDTYGHPAGDLLLCQVVQSCSKLLPFRATFARLGGEEFGALLPRFDLEQTMDLAEAMREAIETIEIDVPAGRVKATASFGCATLEEVDGSVDALIALADQRLYYAKREGRNRVHRPETLAA